MIKHLTPRTEKELKIGRRKEKIKEFWQNCYLKELIVSGLIFSFMCVGIIINLAFLGLLLLSGVVFLGIVIVFIDIQIYDKTSET